MLPERVDGRRERSARTRRTIVASLIDMIEEGQTAPTAGQIAKRAGVAVRSIRQHFPSREALFAAAAAEHARRVEPTSRSIDPSLPLDRRIEAFVSARATELETTAPVRRATSLMASVTLGRAMDAAWQQRRREVEEVFSKEIAGGGKDLLDTLDLLAHARTWDTLRNSMQLTPAAAAAIMTRSIRSILGA